MKNKKQKNTFLSFNIGKEIFAVTVKKVLEVLQTQHVTEIPNVPDFIKGVINFRGNIIPVVETRSKFNMPTRDDEDKYVIIVFVLELKDKKIIIGAKADNVRDVIAIEDNQIQEVPDLGINYNTDFLAGMLKREAGYIMILNIDSVFSTNELIILNEDIGEAVEKKLETNKDEIKEKQNIEEKVESDKSEKKDEKNTNEQKAKKTVKKKTRTTTTKK